MLVLHIIGMALWLTYGLMIGATPVVAANVVAILLDIVLLRLKLGEPATSARDSQPVA
jgi:MtN3 and saliva related transmembrane protein